MEKDNKQDLKINTLENNYKSMAEKIDDLSKTVNNGFKDLKKEFSNMREENDNKYVSKDKFEPVRAITYGMVGILLTSIILAIISGILK
jgi:predicted RNA-binding protein with RPS1 domain